MLGKGFFNRLLMENPSVHFPTAKELAEYKNEMLSNDEWLSYRDLYIEEKNEAPYWWSTVGIFMLESFHLKSDDGSGVAFNVVVLMP